MHHKLCIECSEHHCVRREHRYGNRTEIAATLSFKLNNDQDKTVQVFNVNISRGAMSIISSSQEMLINASDSDLVFDLREQHSKCKSKAKDCDS